MTTAAPIKRRQKSKSAVQRESVRQADSHEPVREDGIRLTRKRKRADDRFYLDPTTIPEGMSYEWKRVSAYGQPDRDHQNNLRDNHWAPVPPDRHPFLAVEKDGMILMERPKYLTLEAQQETYDDARGEVQRVTKGLLETPEGTFTRDHDSVRKVSHVSTERNLTISTRQDGSLVVPG